MSVRWDPNGDPNRASELDLFALRMADGAATLRVVAALVLAFIVLVAALLHSGHARCDHLRQQHDPRADKVCAEAGR